MKSMYAIIETGGKQYKVEPGKLIDIEKISSNVGEKVTFNVLALINGKDTKIGTPTVPNISVKGQLVENKKNDKVIVYKMRPKKHYKRKRGHRQIFSRILIESIEVDGKQITKT